MTTLVSYSLKQLADYVGDDAVIVGDSSYCIDGMNTLQDASVTELSFLANPAYIKYLSASKAGCVILHPDYQGQFSGNQLVIANPYYAFALLSQLFAPKIVFSSSIHETVTQGSSCQLADDVCIGANTVLGNNVVIHSGVNIGPNTYIGDNSEIGAGVFIYPNVSIYHDTVIGEGSIIHSQACIGADGFGFCPANSKGGNWQKIYQLGAVIIGNNVEIGAGTTIDRGALGNTIIGNDVKIDNQVQIAHNVQLGDHTAIAAATAIAGSTTIGKCCTIAGCVGIVGHITITDNVHITGMTLVTKSIRKAGSYSSGVPMSDTVSWRKNAVRFRQLDDIARCIKHKKS